MITESVTIRIDLIFIVINLRINLICIKYNAIHYFVLVFFLTTPSIYSDL